MLLASGGAIPISQLKAGGKVLATSTKTGKTTDETVAAVLVHRDTDLYDLKIRADARTAVIDTTSSHLFWVPGAGGHGGRWVKAGALSYGTHLRTPPPAAWPPSPAAGPQDHLWVDVGPYRSRRPRLLHRLGRRARARLQLPADRVGGAPGCIPHVQCAHQPSKQL
jgi:Pretoxin HINT domain